MGRPLEEVDESGTSQRIRCQMLRKSAYGSQHRPHNGLLLRTVHGSERTHGPHGAVCVTSILLCEEQKGLPFL